MAKLEKLKCQQHGDKADRDKSVFHNAVSLSESTWGEGMDENNHLRLMSSKMKVKHVGRGPLKTSNT